MWRRFLPRWGVKVGAVQGCELGVLVSGTGYHIKMTTFYVTTHPAHAESSLLGELYAYNAPTAHG